MRGTMTVIEPGSVSVTQLTAPPDLEALQKAVGGWIECVPWFNWFIELESESWVPCLALCNEEGKLEGLPYNEVATMAWAAAIMHGQKSGRLSGFSDRLVGNVVVLTGDREFMESL